MTFKSISKTSAKKIKQNVRKIVTNGSLVLTSHINQRMSQKNFDNTDAINVLKNGRLKRKREFDDTYKEWKYSMVGRDIDGKYLTIVFNINEKEKELVLITGARRKK